MRRVFSLLPGNYKKGKKFGKAGGKLKVMEKRKQNRKSAFGLQSLLLNKVFMMSSPFLISQK